MPYLTRRGQYISIISVVSIFTGLITSNIFIFFVGVAGASILIFYFNWMANFRSVIKNIYIDRVESSIHVVEGVEFNISFKLSNKSSYTIPRAVIIDRPVGRVVCDEPVVDVYDVRPNESLILSYKAYTGVGSSMWKGLTLAIYDPLNLFVESIDISLPIFIYGYPYPKFRDGLIRHKPLGISRILNLQSRTGLEFMELREYIYGDDYRMIHWPSTARYGDLVVRVNAVESLINLTLVVDASREMWIGIPGSSPIDDIARVAMWLVDAISKYSGRVNLVVFDGYRYRSYRYYARDSIYRVSTVFSRLIQNRFRSPKDFIQVINTVSSESPGDIMVILTGPGIEWRGFLTELESSINISHPLIYLGIALPTGSSREESLIRLHDANELDDVIDRVKYIRIGYGSQEDLISSLDGVLKIWI